MLFVIVACRFVFSVRTRQTRTSSKILEDVVFGLSFNLGYIQAVRDEEEKKREELVAEFTEKMQKLTEEAEMKAKDLESASAEISQLVKSVEELLLRTLFSTCVKVHGNSCPVSVP